MLSRDRLFLSQGDDACLSLRSLIGNVLGLAHDTQSPRLNPTRPGSFLRSHD